MDADPAAIERVRQHYLFAGLAEADFQVLVPQLCRVELSRKEMLFHRGDPADAFYYVLSGQIELGFIAPSGEKKILEVFGANRTFAEAVTFMGRQVYPAGAAAVSESQLVRIPNAAYVKLLRKDPDACMRLLGDVCQHLHARVIDVERSTIQTAKTRLAAFLLDEVGDSERDCATVTWTLPKHVIASRLAIKPETLSRTLRAMAKEQLIVADEARIQIPSLSRLRATVNTGAV